MRDAPPHRCLHLITDLETGGSEVMLWRLVSRMDRARFRQSVIALGGPGPIGDRIAASEIPVHCLELRRQPARGLGRLLRLLRTNRPDLLVTWLYHADLLGLICGRLVGVPRILWNIRRSGPVGEDGRAVRSAVWLGAKLSRFVDGILVNSATGRLAYQSLGYPTVRMTVIANGLDVDHFRPAPDRLDPLRRQYGIPPHAFVVGSVARWEPVKGYPTLLDAGGRVAGGIPDIWFVLAGRHVEPDNALLAGAIGRAGLSHRTVLLGQRQDPRDLYRMCDAYVSASYSEGFPTVVAEAMACGCPCVVTDAGDSAAVVGDTGLVVPSRDARALAEAIGRMFQVGAEERRRLGDRARRRIQARYELSDVVRQTEQYYERLLAA